ncbi:protein shisa-like-2A [Nerophis ophidion]|uniref:protein shisa-like-2A n=1 Tax=Nerophis ophidion TaxID=159077 RepID=UPI002ADF40CD|nr:protein shisa-like-2A [Nerophis ophidion]
MSAECSSYRDADGVLVDAFFCPKAGSDGGAGFCCGFNDLKYCCDDPDSFYPDNYAYMWWLSIWALVGLSFAAVVLLAFLVTVCVLCYLVIVPKPGRLDNNIRLRPPEGEGAGVSRAACVSGPQGFRQHFMSRRLHSENQSAEPERLFTRCFTGTATSVRVESPS